ncbi:FAD-dependent oxidoreductase [Acidomonas methanolica]|uniref:FAD-dependent oxidoreductase n=1 Tax=Acidomonas methanolica TaxID=437 RepID=UPI00211A7848|nr:FAD-dependent oxidoreductase [Acidomonas methanolica]MCQ9156468.1 FAD-binding oxidoreductase [Acidomonas methanolica]
MPSTPSLSRRSLVAGGMALGGAATLAAERLGPTLSRAESLPAPPSPGSPSTPPAQRPRLFLPPMREDQITDIKVCLRPFRAAGPRYDVEKLGDKTVFHHYGHGGSGWSLSWGSADFVVGRIAATLERRIAVIGCGIIGLTTALTALRAGMDVTIYTRDLLPRTRSVRANGSWTPSSRIALASVAGPAFPDLWERMARFSWASYRSYLGLPGEPIMFLDTYRLADQRNEAKANGEDHSAAPPPAQPGKDDFARYNPRIRDIIPAAIELQPSENPFPVPYAKRAAMMIFNFGAYGDHLLSEFHQSGGRIVMREFHSPADLRHLPERVIVNCPGYAAHDWWQDRSLIPVRGQTTWLPPCPQGRYGVAYRGAEMLCKTDGIMVQGYDLDDLGEMVGVGNAFEHPDRREAARAIGVFTDLFRRTAASRSA